MCTKHMMIHVFYVCERKWSLVYRGLITEIVKIIIIFIYFCFFLFWICELFFYLDGDTTGFFLYIRIGYVCGWLCIQIFSHTRRRRTSWQDIDHVSYFTIMMIFCCDMYNFIHLFVYVFHQNFWVNVCAK